MGMVDITKKNIVLREAETCGIIKLHKETINRIKSKKIEKGDVLETAKISALFAVKKTPEIIPYCHPIQITYSDVEFKLSEDEIFVYCKVKAEAKTGVEMEALYGCTAALLTIWDMVKAYEKDKDGQYPNTRITKIEVLKKIKH